MFTHHKFIHEGHQTALASAVRRYMPGKEVRLAALYQVAAATLNGDPMPMSKGILTSKLTDPNVLVATATDEESGVYVQLARLPKVGRPLLTLGQKWSTEMPPQGAESTQVATKIW